MNIPLARLNLLLQLLFQGIRVDFAYSMVVILVITALFSTPLILGSIKNKVYVAVKAQVEKENNAREITIQQADSSLKNSLGKVFLENLQQDANYKDKYKIVGNYQYVVMVEGPTGAQLLTMDTLVTDDPRTDSLQIRQAIPRDFGLFDVIISNGLGELLYGKEEWTKLWNADSSQFTGKTLSLSINDTPIAGQFQVVAHQTTPGIKVYGSTQLGEALRKHSIGLGAKELGLPVVKDLVQYALPKFETSQCIVSFPQESCTAEQQANIVKRLRADNYQIEEIDGNKTVFEGNIKQIQVTLTKTFEVKGHVEIKPAKGDCEARLSHHLNACPTATATPSISVETSLVSKSAEKPYSVTLASITARSYDLLPGLQAMKDQYGGGMTFDNDGLSEKGIEVAVPYGVKLEMGESLTLQMGKATVPAFVAAYYTCSKSISCPFYANAKMIFRLQNVAEEMATFEPGPPPLFYPLEKYIQVDYDKVLVYANQVEEVETLHHQLQQQFPNYSIDYNRFAIDKLKRQDERLSTLFGLTVILSVIFIVFAVGALAKINIDRRKRQMAQLFILGYSKRFVSILLIGEYLLLTVFASLAAMGTGWVVFATARHYLQSSVETGSTEFNTIVNAMTLDIQAFGEVFVIVIFLTTVVAIFAAYLASRSDPVTLLD